VSDPTAANSNPPEPEHSRFNLSEWALRNQALVRYFIVILAIAGIWAYSGLGQSEDPPFTFKVMVIQTVWPGATAAEVTEQVTERIEKKLQELPELDYLRSYSRPGESQVFFVIKDSVPGARVRDIWYQVRKKIGDIRYTLRAKFQRRIRRHLRQHLCADQRRFQLRADA